MANFDLAYQRTSAAEGGYSNRASDLGGETYRGISRVVHPEWDGWPHVDCWKARSGFPGNLDRDTALQGMVKGFYYAEYWHYDRIQSQDIANELYDSGVNCGVETAGEWLQKSLVLLGTPVVVDGNVGPTTIAAVNAFGDPALLLKCLNIWQGAHYFEICEANPGQRVNLRGWLSRVSI